MVGSKRSPTIARPEVSVSPFNDLRLRVYVDNVYVSSTDRLERVLVGFLFSYNFLPKSWIYFAVNEAREQGRGARRGRRSPAEADAPRGRVATFKVKYLLYF